MLDSSQGRADDGSMSTAPPPLTATEPIGPTAAPSDAQAEVTACGICVPDVEAELYCFGHHQEYQFETACLNACGTPQTGTEIACADVPQLICDAGYSEVDCSAESP